MVLKDQILISLLTSLGETQPRKFNHPLPVAFPPGTVLWNYTQRMAEGSAMLHRRGDFKFCRETSSNKIWDMGQNGQMP